MENINNISSYPFFQKTKTTDDDKVQVKKAAIFKFISIQLKN